MQFLQINADANNLPSDGPVSSSINPLSSGDAIAAHADNNMLQLENPNDLTLLPSRVQA